MDSSAPVTAETQVVQPEKKKRGRPKDENAPKKPKNGYQQFTERRRPELKAAEPALAADLGAFGKRLAEEWQSFPQDEKDRLQCQYDKEMAVWKPLFAEYKKTDAYKEFFEVKQDYMDIKAKKKLNKTMNKDAPKRPKSGYMLYTGSIREETMEKVKAEGLGMGDGARLMSERWNALSESDKAKYGEQSAALKVVYDVEFLKYRKSDAFKNYMDAKSKLEAGQKIKKLTRTVNADAPQRPLSAYAMYRGEIMPDIVAENEKKEKSEKLEVGQIGKLIAEKWTSLDADKKAKYYSEAEQLKEEYAGKLLDWKAQMKYSKFLENRSKVKSIENRQVNLRDLPKRPQSVFALFAEDHKKDVPPGKGEGKGTHALKTKWAETDGSEKQRYETKEKDLKTQWMEAVAEFKESDKFKLFESTKKKIEIEFSKEAEKATTLRFLNDAPTPPAKTPFAVFLGEKRRREGTQSVKKNKQAKVEEVKVAQKEWLALDRQVKSEYEEKRKELKKVFEQSCKDYMQSEKWKEYTKEAKRMKLPIMSLMLNKKLVIKKLNGIIVPSSIPLPAKPDTWPDRPKTAMQIFTKEKRGEVDDLSKISSLWQDLNADERGKYDDMAAEQQKQFEQAMKDLKQSDEGRAYFRATNVAQRKRIICGAKIKYLKDLPKKPKGAVVLFMTQALGPIKKENKLLKGFEIQRLLKEKWIGLGADGQKPFVDDAKQLQQQYDDDMSQFKKSDNWKSFVRVSTPKGKMKVMKGNTLKSPGPRPPASAPKRPLNAMLAFGAEKPDLKLADLQKAFNALPEEDKKERVESAEKKTIEYKEAYEGWKKSADGVRFAKMQEAHQKRSKLQLAKKKRDKLEPKKPLTAYTIFASEARAKLAQDNPGVGLQDLNKKIAEAWADLEGDAKQEVLDKEEKQQNDYVAAMEVFKKSSAYRQYDALLKRLSGKGTSAPTLTPPPKPNGWPSKPLPALMMFGKHVGGSLSEQRGAWGKLEPDEKEEWQNKAKEAETQFQKDLLDFNRTIEGKKYNREKQVFEKKQKTQMAKQRFLGGQGAPKEPKKPPSAYFIFVQDRRAEVAKTMESATVGEVAKKLTEIWGKLEPDVKKDFEDRATSMKATYDEQMAEYKNTAGYKSYQRFLGNINGVKAKKAEAKAKARAAAAKPKAKAGAAKVADSDSDVMGSDSDDSSSSNSDSD